MKIWKYVKLIYVHGKTAARREIPSTMRAKERIDTTFSNEFQRETDTYKN